MDRTSHPSRFALLLVVSVILLSACSSPSTKSPASTSSATKPTDAGAALSTPTSACLPGAYCATVPGPICDNAGAQWTMAADAPLVTCTPIGLDVQFDAHHTEGVVFAPQTATLGSTYALGVTVDLSNAHDGCFQAVTFTHLGGSGPGYAAYAYGICADGKWLIGYAPPSTGKLSNLAEGQVVPTNMYRVVVISAEATRTLLLNGRKVGTVTNASYTTATEAALLLSGNNEASRETAVLRDFEFLASTAA